MKGYVLQRECPLATALEPAGHQAGRLHEWRVGDRSVACVASVSHVAGCTRRRVQHGSVTAKSDHLRRGRGGRHQTGREVGAHVQVRDSA